MNRYSSPLLLTAALVSLTAIPAHATDLNIAPQHNLLVTVADAPNLDSAKAFVSHMSETGIGFLNNANLSDAQRTNEFRKLLDSNFDMATIGRFALGTYWRTSSPSQQAEYQKLFKEMIVRVYSRRFKDYNGQKLNVTAAKADSNGDVMVSSQIIPPEGEKVNVDWRVRSKGGGYKVVDIVVEGVSMALTQRSDFASVIQRGGGKVDVLIDSLRNQQLDQAEALPDKKSQ